MQDEQGANNAMKKHELLQKTIENYAGEIRSLGDRSRAMIEAGHPESDAVAAKQSRVDKMYAGLHDLCIERRRRLDEINKLYGLLREILDLEVGFPYGSYSNVQFITTCVLKLKNRNCIGIILAV